MLLDHSSKRREPAAATSKLPSQTWWTLTETTPKTAATTPCFSISINEAEGAPSRNAPAATPDFATWAAVPQDQQQPDAEALRDPWAQK